MSLNTPEKRANFIKLCHDSALAYFHACHDKQGLEEAAALYWEIGTEIARLRKELGEQRTVTQLRQVGDRTFT